jgi:hypothetical protein
MNYMPKEGDLIKAYNSPEIHRVLKVYPYTGKYPEYFTHVLKLSSEITKSGTIETVVGDRNDWEKVE